MTDRTRYLSGRRFAASGDRRGRAFARLAPVFAVLESWALALWIGALSGFAFVFAPIAFHTIPNLDLFALTVGRIIAALGILGYACGAIALVAIAVRAVDAADRTLDIVRGLIVAAMIVLTAYESRVVVAGMAATARGFHAPIGSLATTDPRRLRYDAQHRDSTRIYGAVLVCGYLVIALGALRARAGASSA